MSDDEILDICEKQYISAEELFKEQEYDPDEDMTTQEYIAELRQHQMEDL